MLLRRLGCVCSNCTAERQRMSADGADGRRRTHAKGTRSEILKQQLLAKRKGAKVDKTAAAKALFDTILEKEGGGRGSIDSGRDDESGGESPPVARRGGHGDEPSGDESSPVRSPLASPRSVEEEAKIEEGRKRAAEKREAEEKVREEERRKRDEDDRRRREDDEKRRKEQEEKKRAEEQKRHEEDTKRKEEEERKRKEQEEQRKKDQTTRDKEDNERKIAAIQERIKQAEERARQAATRAKEAEERFQEKERKFKEAEKKALETEDKVKAGEADTKCSVPDLLAKLDTEKKKLKDSEESASAAERRAADVTERVRAAEAQLKQLQESLAAAQDRAGAADRQLAEQRSLTTRAVSRRDAAKGAAEKAEKALADTEARKRAALQAAPEVVALESRTAEAEKRRAGAEERLRRAEERYRKADEAVVAARQKALDSGTVRRTFRRTGGPLNVGSIVFHDVDRVREEMVLQLYPGGISGWVLVKYSDALTLVFEKSGTGSVDDLAPHLRPTEIQYALLRVPTDAKGSRDVIITWTGPEVKMIEKSKKKAHATDVKKVLQPYQSELLVTGKNNFNLATVVEKSAPASRNKEID